MLTGFTFGDAVNCIVTYLADVVLLLCGAVFHYQRPLIIWKNAAVIIGERYMQIDMFTKVLAAAIENAILLMAIALTLVLTMRATIHFISFLL